MPPKIQMKIEEKNVCKFRLTSEFRDQNLPPLRPFFLLFIFFFIKFSSGKGVQNTCQSKFTNIFFFN
jgi:hypothetical protein